jgi:protocatechuate 3,4-dioxygenase beta subunit
MRPIHLVLALAALCAALTCLWFSLGGSAGTIHAGRSTDGAESTKRSRLEHGPNAGADDDAEEAAGAARTPLAAPKPAPDPKAASKTDKPLFTGRVLVAGEDTGVAGATVFASTNSDWVQLPLDVEPEGLPKNWLKVAKATTDAEGRYRFEDVKPGPLRMAARAAGFAPRYLEHANLPDRAEFHAPDIRLERGVVLIGRVVDRQGRGVGDARLIAEREDGGEGNFVSIPGRGVPVATTSEDGSFRIDEIAAGPWHLIIDSPTHIVAEEEGRTERPGEERRGLVFVLEYGADIRGTLKAAEGTAPAGMRISARPSQEREGPMSSPPDGGAHADPSNARARNAVAADDGTFTVEGLRPGVRYRLTAWLKSDDPSGWKRANGVDAVQAYAGARGVELVYKPESALVLRALDDKTGAPITELSVFAGVGRERILRDEKNEVVRNFPDGRVRFPELRPQPGKNLIVRVSAVGYKDFEKKDGVIKAGEDLDLGDVRLSPAPVVNARIVDDAAGTPVENARIILADKTDDEIAGYFNSTPDQDFWHDSKIMYGRSGPDGTARLTSIPGKRVTLRAAAKGYLVSEPAHVLLGDADQDVEVRMKHGGVVLVHVADASAHAVAGVGVAHKKPGENSSDDGWSSDSAEQKTDAEGIARFEALAAGTHSFRVQDQQAEVWYQTNAPRLPGWQDAIVGATGTTTLEFKVPARGGLFGLVRENGSPLAGARLKLVEVKNEDEGDVGYWNGPNDPLATVSNHEGAYKFENIRCGNYTLFVSHAARRMSAKFTVSVETEPHERDFDLDSTSIEGRVTDIDGRPLAGIEVMAAPKQGNRGDDQPYQMVVTEDDRGQPRVNYEQSARRSEKTDEDGRYVLRGLATEQPLFVQVHGDAVENASSPEITLAPDEVRRGVDFALRRAGCIEVRLLGNPSDRSWYLVRALRVVDGKETPAQTIYLGTWNRTQTIRSLAPGHYKLVLVPQGGSATAQQQSVEADVEPSETSRVSFQVR